VADQIISCPKCSTQIPLNEAFAQHLKEAAQKSQREAEAKIAEDRRRFEEETARKFQAEKERIEKDAAKRAADLRAVELKDLQNQLQEKDRKLEETRQAELALRKRERDLEDRAKSIELDTARRLDAERKAIEEKTRLQADQEHRQKQLEAEKKLADMSKAMEDMKRKLEQGSQQTQGEVVELELEQQLKTLFPYDVIEGVAKGIRGADIVQRVVRNGKVCGTIIWESKQTKVWSDGWIDKLKEDQRTAKAEVAVLMTAALPKDVTNFTQKNGVFVTNQACVPSLAATLRWAIVQHALARSLAESSDGQMKALYQYLTGPEFRQRVEAINDASTLLREQLETEKRLYQKNWATREKLISRVGDSLVGMHGDLQGLGATLEHINAIDGEPDVAETPAVAASSRAALPGPDRAAEEDDELF
jgi:hypothetical protein